MVGVCLIPSKDANESNFCILRLLFEIYVSQPPFQYSVRQRQISNHVEDVSCTVIRPSKRIWKSILKKINLLKEYQHGYEWKDWLGDWNALWKAGEIKSKGGKEPQDGAADNGGLNNCLNALVNVVWRIGLEAGAIELDKDILLNSMRLCQWMRNEYNDAIDLKDRQSHILTSKAQERFRRRFIFSGRKWIILFFVCNPVRIIV